MGRRRKQKKRGGFQDGLKVIGVYPLGLVLDNVGDHEMVIDGWRVRMNSLRYRTFLKDAVRSEEWKVACVYCGLEATHFALQYNPSDKNRKADRAHFNLYAVDEDNNGVWVLITKDHIIPKSQGGKDHLSNMRTACRRCNARKADKMPEEAPVGVRMANFAVNVESITVEPHPNADRLELARVGDYLSIVGKGQFTDGDLVAYIPEQAVVPDDILEELNLTGKLAGKQANRVKAIRLRGILSQGICYPAREGWKVGDDVTEELGIIKYVPPIPSHMEGEMFAAGLDATMKYDIENYKRYPDVLQDGEQVVFTEKLHGTWTQVGVLPEDMANEEYGAVAITSKGMADRGLAFILNEENEKNLYVRAARAYKIDERIRFAFEEFLEAGSPVFVLGETFGAGVQDLAYGHNAGRDNIGFRVFDVYVGTPGQGKYLNDEELESACQEMGLERVPVLYRGPFSKAVMEEHTNGRETVSGKQQHIREGIVMRPVVERRHDALGRVQLKSVSEKYLLRKGGTELQ